jgi:hypothetical protein
MNPLHSRQSFSGSSTSTALRAEYEYEYEANPASNLNLKTRDFGLPPVRLYRPVRGWFPFPPGPTADAVG